MAFNRDAIGMYHGMPAYVLFYWDGDRKMTKEKKTLKELMKELEEYPEREKEIRQQMTETSEFQKMVAENYISPSMRAASTYDTFKHKDEDFTFSGLREALENQNNALRSNDLTRLEDMLFTQAHTLDMLFHTEARRAIRQDYIGQYKIYMDLAFKAQRQCRANLEALAEIKNPRPYIQNNKAQYQQVNNGSVDSRAREKKTKSSNELLEDKGNDEQWLDIGASETTSGNDKELEAVGKKHRSKND